MAVFISLFLLSPLMHAVMAQTTNSTSQMGVWEPPKNFVDPVTIKIQEFQSQGLTDDQITAKLAEVGMGWFPKTGATWIGRALTAEEIANMPNTKPVAPPNQQTQSSNGITTALQTGKTSCMRTDAYSWTGVSAEVVSGSMNVAFGQTNYHYLCVQLGDLDDATSWTEIVLTHNFGETYQWSTYDPDEGEWYYYMDKNTAITATDTYTIMLDGTHDALGWKYDVWINYQWVRSGHLPSLFVQGGFQKEVYSNTGTFTNDASHAVFDRCWLHNAQGWSYWTNSINTWWITANPVQQTHAMDTYSYKWETWVQN